jgi:lipoprotein-anchoring transpeptidase ErfK/SrfK
MRLAMCLLAAISAAQPAGAGSVWTGTVQDSDPTRPDPNDYLPPTPVGRGNGNAYFGAGYIEYLYSGGRTPQLPPKRIYVGPLERSPYGNRRLQLRAGMSPRAGTYVGLPAPIEPDEAAVATDPYVADPSLGSPSRQIVPFRSSYAAGTIVIRSAERALYLVGQDGQARRYKIAVGRDGFGFHGIKRITAKREWPDWRPPADMQATRPDLPAHMAGGPANPLGARALYLGSSLYRIHGTNEPETIGTAVSSGCFRMTNTDIIDLYARVPTGTKVVVE